MIDINECKNKAKLLAEQSKKILGHQKLNDFFDGFDKIISDYQNKYMFSSHAINLHYLNSGYQWMHGILEDKVLLTPIIVDRMVNKKDLYALSLYQNLYAGTDLIPNVDEDGLEFHKHGGGENALALITGCHWIEQKNLNSNINVANDEAPNPEIVDNPERVEILCNSAVFQSLDLDKQQRLLGFDHNMGSVSFCNKILTPNEKPIRAAQLHDIGMTKEAVNSGVDVNHRNAKAINLDYESGLVSQLLEHTNVKIVGSTIFLDETIVWQSSYNLTVLAENSVTFKSDANIISKGGGWVFIKSGMKNSNDDGTVIFEGKTPQIIFEDGGKALIYYNPTQEDPSTHKYHNPNGYFRNVYPQDSVVSYMLVNNLNDLQSIRMFLHGNYALSQNIDASETKFWNDGLGFTPLLNKTDDEVMPFTGNFEGAGFEISNLYINRLEEDFVGIFGRITGSKEHKVVVENLKLHGLSVTGSDYVGGISGIAEYANFNNIEFDAVCNIKGKGIVGAIVGSASGVGLRDIKFNQDLYNLDDIVTSNEYGGLYFGTCRDSIIYSNNSFCSNLESNYGVSCYGFEANLMWEQI